MKSKAADNVQLSDITPKRQKCVSPCIDGPAASSEGRTGKARILAWRAPDLPQQLGLFSDQAIDLGALRRELGALAEAAHAGNTRRAYRADWRSFETFCRDTARAPLPADPQTVMYYLAYEAQQGRAAATITRRLIAINAQHKANGMTSPCTADVGLVLVAIRRRYGATSHPKTAITPDELRRMLGSAPKTATGIRDSAILSLGFASGLRRTELAALDLADAVQRTAGLVLRILRGKGDQQSRGREIGIHYGRRSLTCPIRRLKAWLKVRGNHPGPLFSRVTHGIVTHERVTGRTIARVIKRAVRRIGMDASQYAGHSLRSGCATAAAAAGTDVLVIARRLGHKSARTTERYIREGNLFSIDPMRQIL